MLNSDIECLETIETNHDKHSSGNLTGLKNQILFDYLEYAKRDMLKAISNLEKAKSACMKRDGLELSETFYDIREIIEQLDKQTNTLGKMCLEIEKEIYKTNKGENNV